MAANWQFYSWRWSIPELWGGVLWFLFGLLVFAVEKPPSHWLGTKDSSDEVNGHKLFPSPFSELAILLYNISGRHIKLWVSWIMHEICTEAPHSKATTANRWCRTGIVIVRWIGKASWSSVWIPGRQRRTILYSVQVSYIPCSSPASGWWQRMRQTEWGWTVGKIILRNGFMGGWIQDDEHKGRTEQQYEPERKVETLRNFSLS